MACDVKSQACARAWAGALRSCGDETAGWKISGRSPSGMRCPVPELKLAGRLSRGWPDAPQPLSCGMIALREVLDRESQMRLSTLD